jgi:hypothetical protein
VLALLAASGEPEKRPLDPPAKLALPGTAPLG